MKEIHLLVWRQLLQKERAVRHLSGYGGACPCHLCTLHLTLLALEDVLVWGIILLLHLDGEGSGTIQQTLAGACTSDSSITHIQSGINKRVQIRHSLEVLLKPMCTTFSQGIFSLIFWSECNLPPALSRCPTKPSRFTQIIVGTIHTGDKLSCIGVDIPEIDETIIIREFLACQHLHDTADSGLKHTCNLLVKESYLLIFTYLLILEIQPEGSVLLYSLANIITVLEPWFGMGDNASSWKDHEHRF